MDNSISTTTGYNNPITCEYSKHNTIERLRVLCLSIIPTRCGAIG